jgi:hypothetical protein
MGAQHGRNTAAQMRGNVENCWVESLTDKEPNGSDNAHSMAEKGRLSPEKL